MIPSRAVLPACVLLTIAQLAQAQDPQAPPPVVRQSLDDAWWTGPMLAPNASTLPRGHFLVEPYLYDVILLGRYDTNGTLHRVPHAHGLGSLAYALYGFADRLTVGLLPVVSYNMGAGASSSGLGLGDLTLQAQLRLTQFHEGRWLPTTSLTIQETLPTGKADRLTRASDGIGGGAYTTTLALYSQTYFWLPNGRILRMRLNASEAFSGSVDIADASVYGTRAGFRGQAWPGSSLFLNAAWEYSLTKKWVLALDLAYRHAGNTRVTGNQGQTPGPVAIQFDSGSSEGFGLAPAIEFNWKRNLGVLVGVRVIAAGHNTAFTISPAVAVNFVR